jgi:hypothetical protein
MIIVIQTVITFRGISYNSQVTAASTILHLLCCFFI